MIIYRSRDQNAYHFEAKKSVKVFKFYITTKFDGCLFNVRNVMIVFFFYANEAFGHALICLMTSLRIRNKQASWGLIGYLRQ